MTTMEFRTTILYFQPIYIFPKRVPQFPRNKDC